MDVAKHKGIKDIELQIYKIEWEPYFKVDSINEDEILSAFNKELKTNITKEELNNPNIMKKILDDVKMGEDVMVRGTPTIFINGEKDNTKLKYEALGNK